MKAILILDMPTNCIECPLHQRYCGAICRALEKEHTEERFYHREQWCPLKPLPQPKNNSDEWLGDVWVEGYEAGYNKCIEEIEE